MKSKINGFFIKNTGISFKIAQKAGVHILGSILISGAFWGWGFWGLSGAFWGF